MDPHDALYLVRRYSEKMVAENPEEPLAQSLAKHVEREEQQEMQGKRLYGESVSRSLSTYRGDQPFGGEYFSEVFNGVAHLEKVTDELEDSWKKVAKELNNEEHTRDISRRNTDEKPDINKLAKLMKDAQKKITDKRETKMGKAKEWFHRVAGTLNSHTWLFDILPSNDKYFSVLVGALTACIKASVAHQRIAGKVSDCLEMLSDQTRSLWKVIRRMPRSEYIKDQVAQFYCALFKLLVKVLEEWYGPFRKRLKHSFGSSFEDYVQGATDRMAYHVKVAKEEFQEELHFQNNQHLRLILGALGQAGLLGHAVDSTKPIIPRIPGQLAIGTQLSLLDLDSKLPHAGYQASPEPIDGHLMHVHSESDQDQNPPSPSSFQSGTPDWTTETVQEATEWLKRYLQEGHTARLIEKARYLSVNGLVYSHLMLWASRHTSEALWIEGPRVHHEPSQNTLTSAFMVANLCRLGIPVITYFCAYHPSQWQTFDRADELLKMVYALVYQAASFLPEHLVADEDEDQQPDLSSARLHRLASDVQSLPEAIDLLGELVSIGPPLLYCVVDGVQLLDRQQDSPFVKDCLNRFVEVLKKTVISTVDHSRIVKIGFSTDGHSIVLQDGVKGGWLDRQRYDIEKQDVPLRLRPVDVAGIDHT